MKKLKITERGYPGHFCASSKCVFHRNTLIEYGDTRIVVSTVGNMQVETEALLALENKKIKIDLRQIGLGRFYETMAFRAKFEDPYWEADVSNQISFNSKWAIDTLTRETDKEADEMHDVVVKEISETIVKYGGFGAYDKCSCGKKSLGTHTCPYKEDINDDYDTLCNCCEDCRQNCIDDI